MLTSLEQPTIISPRLQKIVDRITPIENPVVTIGPMPIFDVKGNNVETVNIDWCAANPVDSGHVEISFVERIIPRPGENVLVKVGDRHLALSSISAKVLFDDKYMPIERSAVAGSRAFFTLIGTINEVARISGKPITHMTLCNPYSISLLEKLMAEGIYHYCSLDGSISNQSQKFMGQTLFACRYPFADIDKVFGKFAVKEAVDKLVEMRI